MAVLGLVCQGRGTVATIHNRLYKAFPHANYARNSAHTGLPRLAEKGYVRLVREGAEPSQDVYEITPPGLRRFEAWLHEVAAGPPPLRDPLQGKLTFIDMQGIDNLVATVRAYEEAAAEQYAHAHGRINALTIRDLAGSARLKLERIRLEYTATLWGQQAKRMTGLREKLEDLQEQIDHETHEAHG